MSDDEILKSALGIIRLAVWFLGGSLLLILLILLNPSKELLKTISQFFKRR
jgi:hypothetical protein